MGWAALVTQCISREAFTHKLRCAARRIKDASRVFTSTLVAIISLISMHELTFPDMSLTTSARRHHHRPPFQYMNIHVTVHENSHSIALQRTVQYIAHSIPSHPSVCECPINSLKFKM